MEENNTVDLNVPSFKETQNYDHSEAKFWFEEPSILIEQDNITKIYPTAKMTFNQRLNAWMRMSIALGIVMSVVSSNTVYMFIPVLGAIITYNLWRNHKKETENFFMTGGNSNLTLPTENNPMMNFNVITDPRDKPPPAPANKMIDTQIKNNLDKRLFKNVSEIWSDTESNRQFYTVSGDGHGNPDTVQFAKWAYQTGPTCKEKSAYCAPPWGN